MVWIALSSVQIISILMTGQLLGMRRLKYPLGRLRYAVGHFRDSLYRQKHGFYFREVKQWEDYLVVSSLIAKDGIVLIIVPDQDAFQKIIGGS